MDLKKGDKVHYIGHKGAAPENGIVLSVHQKLLGYAHVVYHCADEWDNYENYTAQLTDLDHLHEGWFSKSETGTEL